MQYDVTGCVIFKSNQIEYLENKAVTKILSKKLYSDLTDLSNAIRKLSEKISFHRHFKASVCDNTNLSLNNSSYKFLACLHGEYQIKI